MSDKRPSSDPKVYNAQYAIGGSQKTLNQLSSSGTAAQAKRGVKQPSQAQTSNIEGKGKGKDQEAKAYGGSEKK